jgi:phosphatidylglycerol:prolipoprotein diacylglycerol transferase
MVFPQAHDPAGFARHPSQLYQAAGEGLLLFVILWLYARKPRATGQISGVFMAGYGVLRFAAEYFREPDDFLGYRALGWSQGQWLSLPMIVGGIAIFVWATRRNQRPA